MDCKTDKLDEAGEERMLSAALKSPTMLHPVPPRLARRVKALSPGKVSRCRLLFARRRWPAAAAALCALAAAGAVWWGELSERAAAILGSGGVVPRAAAIGETGETSGTGGSSPVAPVTTPVPPDSPVPPVPAVPFVPEFPSPTLSKEPTMNATTLRTVAASAAIAAATGAPLATSASPAGSGGAITAASNSFTLDTRPSPQTLAATIEFFSTQPTAFVLSVR